MADMSKEGPSAPPIIDAKILRDIFGTEELKSADKGTSWVPKQIEGHILH